MREGLSKAAGGNFFPDRVCQNSLGFEPGQLGQDAGLGSGGEGHMANKAIFAQRLEKVKLAVSCVRSAKSLLLHS